MTKEKTIKILHILEKLYPNAECALNFSNIFELLVSVMLSAQTTDKSVNSVTPQLFGAFPTPKDIAMAEETVLEDYLRKIGMYKTKARNLKAMAIMLCENYGEQVPGSYDELIKLPGVGRKTANVVLSVGFGEQRIAVDTHVFRVANKIGMVSEKDPLNTELSLMKVIPRQHWTKTHHSLIFHGRNCCKARKPDCENCAIKEFCMDYKNRKTSI